MEEIKKQIEKLTPPAGYERLHDILYQAIHQAAYGKGKERHSSGEPFEDQPICVVARWVGIGAQLGQAIKKTRESSRLLNIKGPEAAKFELLGAINWIAAAIILLEETIAKNPSGTEQSLPSTIPICSVCGRNAESKHHTCMEQLKAYSAEELLSKSDAELAKLIPNTLHNNGKPK